MNKFCAAAALSLLCGVPICRGTIPEDFVRQEYELSPTASITIRNAAGRILVYGANEPRLKIVAMRRAFTQERLEGIKVAVSIKDDAVVIDTIYPPASKGLLPDRSGTVDYEILVPQTCTLEQVELGKGEVLIQGMRGEHIAARLGSGLLHVRNCFASGDLQVDEGRLDIFYAWWERRPFSLSAKVAAGDLVLRVPAGAALHFDGASERGKIRSAFGKLGDVRELRDDFGGESEATFRLRIEDGNIRLERSY
ncbi:MAG: hypothetical protein ACR2NX_05855 [Chthoniobacterales bacterium]